MQVHACSHCPPEGGWNVEKKVWLTGSIERHKVSMARVREYTTLPLPLWCTVCQTRSGNTVEWGVRVELHRKEKLLWNYGIHWNHVLGLTRVILPLKGLSHWIIPFNCPTHMLQWITKCEILWITMRQPLPLRVKCLIYVALIILGCWIPTTIGEL